MRWALFDGVGSAGRGNDGTRDLRMLPDNRFAMNLPPRDPRRCDANSRERGLSPYPVCNEPRGTLGV